MNRLLYNRAIINKLSELIEKYPHQRFGQLLWNCNIIRRKSNDEIIDPFYEEPDEIWNRMISNEFCFSK